MDSTAYGYIPPKPSPSYWAISLFIYLLGQVLNIQRPNTDSIFLLQHLLLGGSSFLLVNGLLVDTGVGFFGPIQQSMQQHSNVFSVLFCHSSASHVRLRIAVDVCGNPSEVANVLLMTGKSL
jgi:hypothetical protein